MAPKRVTRNEAQFGKKVCAKLAAAISGRLMTPSGLPKRLAHVQALEQRVATPVAAMAAGAVPGAKPAVADIDTLVTMFAQERVIGSDDLGCPFLKAALAASRCVCRITARTPSGGLLGYGTGTLVGPAILLTNHHVLESAENAMQSEVTFGFETGITATSDERIVRLQPQHLFITDEVLDFTIVAVAPTDTRGQSIDDIGYISLNPAEGKAINGEFVNMIQRIRRRTKMFALRENQIVDVLTNYLHYTADTAPGSSGAPVFNDQYEVVALHHSGVPARGARALKSRWSAVDERSGRNAGAMEGKRGNTKSPFSWIVRSPWRKKQRGAGAARQNVRYLPLCAPARPVQPIDRVGRGDWARAASAFCFGQPRDLDHAVVGMHKPRRCPDRGAAGRYSSHFAPSCRSRGPFAAGHSW